MRSVRLPIYKHMQPAQPNASLAGPGHHRVLRLVMMRALWATGALLLLLSQIAICRGGFTAALNGSVDFRALYAAGYIVRTGHAALLYDYGFEHSMQNAVAGPRNGTLPFVYPPGAALLFVPLSLLHYRAAYNLFFVCNLMLAAMTAALLRPRLPALAALWRPLPFVLVLGFWPLAVVLLQGQVSMLLLLFYCGCYVALQRKRPFLAGMLLACALIKFQIALPVALLFLLWRRWRFMSGFATGAAAFALLSLYVVGFSGLAAYWHFMLSMAGHISAGATEAGAQSTYAMFPATMPNVHGLFYLLCDGTRRSIALTIVFSIAAVLRAFVAGPSLPVALLAALLVSYHVQPHDLSLLLLPILLLLDASLTRRRSTRMRSVASEHRYAAAMPWNLVGMARTSTLWTSLFLLFFPIIPVVLIANSLASLLAIPIAAMLLCIAALDTTPLAMATPAANGTFATAVVSK